MTGSSGWGAKETGRASPRQPASWLVLAVMTLGLLVPGAGAHGGAPRVSAVLSPHVQFLGDSAGTVFTFTVSNPANGQSVGRVEIDRPSSFWAVVGCPGAPSGWTAHQAEDGCRYDNEGGSAGELPPGASSSAFQLTAASRQGTADRTGSFHITVGGAEDDEDSPVRAVAGVVGGLDVTAFSFEVLDVVASRTPVAPAAPCPPANRTATPGADQVLVVCGKNRTTQTLVPVPALSTLGGTLLQDGGVLSSGPVPAGSQSSVVLGSWTGARTIAGGRGKTVVATIGSSSTQTSPPATLAGYEAVVMPPQAPVVAPLVANPKHVTTREDSSVGIELTGSGGDGSPLTVAVAAQAWHLERLRFPRSVLAQHTLRR